MLATYILRLGGFGLKGLIVLESFYDRDLNAYYKHLQMDLNHNYYLGRNEADITRWLEFFVKGLATVFEEAAADVQAKNNEYLAVELEMIRILDPQQRLIFAKLAFKCTSASTSDLCKWLSLSDRTIREKVKNWIQMGFLHPRDQDAQRIRSVVLAAEYYNLAEEMRKEPERYNYLLK